MSEQRFKVGEKVILQSVDFPELNGGPYVIVDYEEGDKMDSTTGEVLSSHFYKLDVHYTWWFQSAIRKYYPPADVNFNELMLELNIEKTKEK